MGLDKIEWTIVKDSNDKDKLIRLTNCTADKEEINEFHDTLISAVIKDGSYKVFHHNDNDGLVGAHMMWFYAGMRDLNKYYKCDRNTVTVTLDRVEIGDTVFIIDYLADMDTMREMLNKGVKHIFLLDHHKTAGDLLLKNKDEITDWMNCGNFSVIYDANQCGTKIVRELLWHYNYLVSPLTPDMEDYKNASDEELSIGNFTYGLVSPVETDTGTFTLTDLSAQVNASAATWMLTDLVDVYDRCTDKTIKEAWYLNQFTFKHSMTHVGSTMWTNLLTDPEYLTNALEIGKQIYDLNRQLDEVVYQNLSKEVLFHGLNCRVVYGFGTSYSFNDHISDYDAVIIYRRLPNGKYKYSIFSDTGVNVLEIADQYGGGGHIPAAGFMLDKDIFNIEEQCINEDIIFKGWKEMGAKNIKG